MAVLIDLARQPNISWSISVYGAVVEFATRYATIPEIETGDGTRHFAGLAAT